MATVKDFRNDVRPNWCPGCGDFSVQASIQRALAALGKEPHEVAIVSGIGCSGRISGYINAYGFHGVHGRALSTAQGLKLANRNLTVIAAGGDGDGFGIGLNHFMHAVRRNMDITYIVMDNQIYGLTKGQHSPTSAHGFKAKTTPSGNIENAIVPAQVALAAGITFLAQGFSSDVNQLVRLIQEAIQHRGFALVNVFSPCVTYNKINTYDWYKEHIRNLDEIPDYDPTDRAAAMKMVVETHGLCTGLIYKDEHSVPYEDQIPGYREEPIAFSDIHMDPALFEKTLRAYA
ncbi:2-oxoglutarate ferredoxin oxidoreductase subunit beta [Alicyclobacillus cellulosilyticus]|uniref:2-oxoglutarate ferredoxin oxidoreductase subunit beta n=1 Tax=Alicyclobacillus cellulosilyticus TaxID=1003997 RepID=A0A917K4U4_9BACL|nr:2-oxoacid:ferredoxin oxidoreductase subunit beta [Alicyclobacillus cellulosilyticus]GGI97552.1 2-oxoglutarate ferredoxin oxidoreductase subunit beta [Alicyclobacillus cellulosilyticus]